MAFDMKKVEQEVRTGTDTEMKKYVEANGIESGWSQKNHAGFQTEQLADMATSGLDEDELKFRFYIFLNLTVNPSSFRQHYEKLGVLKPAGPKKSGADLAGEYLSRFGK